MALLIGTDEAGYGPNLGPLVISATVWRIPDMLPAGDLYRHLRDVVMDKANQDDERVAMADSKVLYQSRGSLASLERGVLAALNVSDNQIQTWRDVWNVADDQCRNDLDRIPWYASFEERLPIDASRDEVKHAMDILRIGLSARHIELVKIASRVLFPARFNDLVERLGNKSTVLSHETIALIKSLLDCFGNEPATVFCDKHGGRNKYASVLTHFFSGAFVEIEKEGRSESVYRLRHDGRRMTIHFKAGGESLLPPALASMTSKYLRELAMRALNAFWKRHIPNLKPTAGYPVDARRFKAEIEEQQTKLGIEDHMIWRNR